LKEKGYTLQSIEGFFAKGRCVPLANGEIERATDWGDKLTKSLAKIN
jgi:hypothetical protein